jgi:hypothetical protein
MENRMRRSLISRRAALATGLAFSVSGAGAGWVRAATVSTLKAEDGRDIRLSTWAAQAPQKGLILFSHGALSAPEKYETLLGPWSRAGFKILAPLHVDSTDYPDHAKYGMVDSWRFRIKDMRAVAAFAGADHYIAAGHSYGALMALTLGGAEAVIPPGVSGPLRDPRATCVVAFSPPGASPGLITAEGYSHLAVPALIETGTADSPPAAMGGGDYHTHLLAFDVAPPGDKYAMVLEGADHYFGGLICRPELPGPKQTAAFDHAVPLSIDFLEGFGTGESGARKRLDDALSKALPTILMRK